MCVSPLWRRAGERWWREAEEEIFWDSKNTMRMAIETLLALLQSDSSIYYRVKFSI